MPEEDQEFTLLEAVAPIVTPEKRERVEEKEERAIVEKVSFVAMIVIFVLCTMNKQYIVCRVMKKIISLLSFRYNKQLSFFRRTNAAIVPPASPCRQILPVITQPFTERDDLHVNVVFIQQTVKTIYKNI